MSEFQTVSESEVQSVEGGVAPVVVAVVAGAVLLIMFYPKKAY